MEYPDLTITDIDAAGFQAAYERCGSLVLRDVFDPASLAPVLERAREAYFVRDWQYRRGQLPERLYRGMYEFGHIPAQDLDAPDGTKLSILNLVTDSAIWPLYQGLFGPKIAFMLGNCLPRRQSVEGVAAPTPFHQDGAFLGDPALVMNAWIPLVPCGQTAPGLEVVLNPTSELITPPEMKGDRALTYKQLELPESYIASRFGEDCLWAPRLNVGDVLFFSHLTIHRTYQRPEMDQPRISLEIRCVSGDAADAMQGRHQFLIRE
jgi:ectoine hydroxylase-related dioxygenase (phytanoyl-CoA dioxygenase family)